jgi:hypothetical protein
MMNALLLKNMAITPITTIVPTTPAKSGQLAGDEFDIVVSGIGF